MPFSTNRYHQTWHVLSGLRGAQLLAHLLWGLAYQRVPGTLVVIGAPWLNPEPFAPDDRTRSRWSQRCSPRSVRKPPGNCGSGCR